MLTADGHLYIHVLLNTIQNEQIVLGIKIVDEISGLGHQEIVRFRIRTNFPILLVEPVLKLKNIAQFVELWIHSQGIVFSVHHSNIHRTIARSSMV